MQAAHAVTFGLELGTCSRFYQLFALIASFATYPISHAMYIESRSHIMHISTLLLIYFPFIRLMMPFVSFTLYLLHCKAIGFFSTPF